MRRILLSSLFGVACAIWGAPETALLPLARASEAGPARVTAIVPKQVDDNTEVLVRVHGSVTHRTERLDNPPRLVLDLVGVSPAFEVGTLRLRDPWIRQIRSSHFSPGPPSVVRVVFDLVGPVDYRVESVVEGVVVVFARGGASGLPAEGASGERRVASPPSAQRPAPSVVPASGVLLVQAPSSPQAQAPPTARPVQSRLISMDFKDADINNLLRILAEFSGINIVSGEDVKGKVTVRLNNVPWDQALEAVVKAGKFAYVREGNVIRVDKLENLSKEAEAQIKLEQAEAEFRLKQDERRAQLEAQKKRFEEEIGVAQERRRQEEIKTQQEQIKRQQAELELRAAEEKRKLAETSLVVETIPLKYAHVGTRKVEIISFFKDSVREDERKGIEEAVKPLLTSRGSVLIDERTNTLILRDIPENLERIKKFVETVDKPLSTIQVDARIVEINRSDALTLGIQWGGVFTADTGKGAPVVTARGMQGPGSTSAVNLPPGSPVQFSGVAGTGLGLAVGLIASNFALDAALQALEAEGKAEVISRPSVVTQENQPATVASGESIPIISVLVVQGAQQANVTYKDVTTRIQVIPRTTPDKKIHLTVGLKKEDLIEILESAGQLAPRTSKREAVTNLLLEDGQTAVIGGLHIESKGRQERRIPFFGRIPILGWLFKSRLAEGSVKELMIFLTARIIEGAPKVATAPPSDGTPPASNPATGAVPPGTEPSGGSQAPAVAVPPAEASPSPGA